MQDQWAKQSVARGMMSKNKTGPVGAAKAALRGTLRAASVLIKPDVKSVSKSVTLPVYKRREN